MSGAETDGTVRLRRVPPAGLGPMLGVARLRAGMRLREAARLLGISHPYLIKLETGQRCPSVTVARKLVVLLALDAEETAALFAAAVDDAGRDHPARRSTAGGACSGGSLGYQSGSR